MDWQKGKDCEIYEKYPVEKRLCVVSTGMNVIVWRKHPWQISFQKAILKKCAQEQGFRNIQFFADDGYSGANFNRPDWKRMIELVENDKVGVIIAKDMSRIGRNYLEVGLYTETLWTRTQKADRETGAADNK